MGEVIIRHYIIGILLFTFMILGGIAMLGEFNKDDPTFVDADKYEQFNNTFNVYGDIDDEVGGMRNQLEEADTDPSVFGVLNSLIMSAWQTLRLIVSSFGFMDGVFNGLSTMFGVPAWVPGIIILLITVVLIFVIFSAIFQRDI